MTLILSNVLIAKKSAMQLLIFFIIACVGEVLSKFDPIVPDFEPNGMVLDCGKRFSTNTTEVRGNIEHPWLVKLLYNYPKITRCGGVLVADEWVLSSSFCIRSDLLQAVMVGEYDTSDDWDCLRLEFDDIPQRILISKKVFNHHYDVGLINLNNRVRTNAYVNAICLPYMEDILYPGVIGRVAGWSHLNRYKILYNDQLKLTDLTIMNSTECGNIFNFTIPPSRFCAQAIKRQVPCIAMPGGPFMEYSKHKDDSRYHLSGILVREANECNTKYPLIFLDIRYVQTWVADILRTPTYGG